MSSVIKILPHYTYEEYCKREGRWELIEGIPYAMSPAPSPRHQWVSSNIKYELKDAIKIGLLDFPASIVVEILSPSTAMKGRNNKFYIYQSYKIHCYIIVDVDKNTVEIYLLDKEGKYQLQEFSQQKPFTFFPEKDCSIDVLFKNIWE